MTTYIGLLRAVNLGGRNVVSMAMFRELLTGLGLEDAQTLLQSGNAVFRGRLPAAATGEQAIERACHETFGFAVEAFVRTRGEWDAIVARNPFPAAAESDPAHLLVMACRAEVPAASVAKLQSSIKGPEQVQSRGREVYIVYPAGIGESKLTAALLEKALGARGTARNWKTVLKLQARAASIDTPKA